MQLLPSGARELSCEVFCSEERPLNNHAHEDVAIEFYARLEKVTSPVLGRTLPYLEILQQRANSQDLA